MKKFVAIMMGSDSDWATMQNAHTLLQDLKIDVEVRVLSAHRTPELVREYVVAAEQRGCQAFIAAAGLAAHLAGSIAALTVKPVIGVPLEAGPLQGMDALLSTVQMPAGIPVATVAIGKHGAQNAALLAAQIMALNDEALTVQLKKMREQKSLEIQAKNQQFENLANK